MKNNEALPQIQLSCHDLRCHNMSNPLGIDERNPLFSWKLNSGERGVIQTKYCIKVHCSNLDGQQKIMWDTGLIPSDKCFGILYSGEPLASVTRYIWEVTIWDNKGNSCTGESWFETAFLQRSDWIAKWIEPMQEPAFREPKQPFTGFQGILANLSEVKMQPTQLLRREFRVDKAVKKARIYATAHGVYHIKLNGKRVGRDKLTPEYTPYCTYLQYQTYDITSDLQSGGNVIGMVIADGWWCGKVGMVGRSCSYGDRLAGLFQMEIELEDGNVHTVYSDEQCKSATGPIRYSDLFVGEKYDATMEQAEFCSYGFDASNWKPVQVLAEGYENLVAQYGPTICVSEVRKPQKIWTSPKGEVILDVGQVMTGYLRMRVRGNRGRSVKLEYTETVDKDGNYLNNASGRFTIQTDIYILNGNGEEVYEPEFTFHGFRYVRLTGYPGIPSADDFDVLVLGSNLETTGRLSCSDERLNQLQRNIVQSQRSNMLTIPMDCPQREKQGWTGDAQIFTPTACFNMDMLAFFRRWLKMMREEQRSDGQVPNVIPYVKAYQPGEFPGLETDSSAGWGDAAIIIPWKLYQIYGDMTVLSENYDMMRRWLSYVQHAAETQFPEGLELENDTARRERMRYLWNTGFQFGDWLTPSLSLDPITGEVNMRRSALMTMHIVPSCFYAYSAELLSHISELLGKKDDAARYKELHSKIRDAFIGEFVDENGLIDTDLQGVYVLALSMKLVPEETKENTVKQLADMIRENGNRLDTGFLSVPFLLDSLFDNGYPQLAYDLLFQDQCPSWLYEVKMGATTIWELWQAILPDGTITTASYNHYAFGCVGDWMYRILGGLREASPAYKEIEICPQPDARLHAAAVSFDSAYGLVGCDWRKNSGEMKMIITIPVNTSATVYLPKAQLESVTESSITLDAAAGITDCVQEKEGVKLRVLSGTYQFRYPLA